MCVRQLPIFLLKSRTRAVSCVRSPVALDVRRTNDTKRTQFRDLLGELDLGSAGSEAVCLKRAEEWEWGVVVWRTITPQTPLNPVLNFNKPEA